MGFGLLIIGDEITSGSRRDKHFTRAIDILRQRGLKLAWVQYLGDDRGLLTATLARTLAGRDVVFSFGGIGATPDDHTRQAAAAALGVELQLHPDAEAEIRARFGAELTVQRLRLGEFPKGARIIPNPFNRIPGFSVGDHHFLPGFPEMAWPMMESVLEQQYGHLFHARPEAEEAVVVYEVGEGLLLDLMQRITADYPEATLFSLPSFGNAQVRRHLELGMRGEPVAVRAAMAEIRAELDARGDEYHDRREAKRAP